MRFDVLTVLPGMFDAVGVSQIWKKAEAAGLLELVVHNIRDYAHDKHKTVDDTPYGGGPGMLLKVEPLVEALEAVPTVGKRIVLMASPQGKVLNQRWAQELSSFDQIVMISGRYEGVDERFIEGWIDHEFSIGDYVLSGGELPSMVLMETVGRLIPGVVGSWESVEEDSFSSGFLKYPQYTRPPIYRGMEVPEVLRNGHHLQIEKWRKMESEKRTQAKRPDLLVNKEVMYDKK